MLLGDAFKHQTIQVPFVILLCKNKLTVNCVWIKLSLLHFYDHFTIAITNRFEYIERLA